MSFWTEFKNFAIRGNVVDLSVGIIVGASFNKIVDVIVNGIMLPPIGLVTGGINFADKKIVLRRAIYDSTGKVLEPENVIKYGELIQTTIVFIITAFAVFLLIKGINALRRRHEEKNKEVDKKELSLQEKLLMEIRDLLGNRKS